MRTSRGPGTVRDACCRTGQKTPVRSAPLGWVPFLRDVASRVTATGDEHGLVVGLPVDSDHRAETSDAADGRKAATSKLCSVHSEIYGLAVSTKPREGPSRSPPRATHSARSKITLG